MGVSNIGPHLSVGGTCILSGGAPPLESLGVGGTAKSPFIHGSRIKTVFATRVLIWVLYWIFYGGFSGGPDLRGRTGESGLICNSRAISNPPTHSEIAEHGAKQSRAEQLCD